MEFQSQIDCLDLSLVLKYLEERKNSSYALYFTILLYYQNNCTRYSHYVLSVIVLLNIRRKRRYFSSRLIYIYYIYYNIFNIYNII